jgi:hypothetical protein
MISKQTRVIKSSRLSIADLGGEAVILDSRSGQYYGLNAVGQFVLESLDGQRTVSDIVELVVARYGVETSQAEADILAFLGELDEAALIDRAQTS